MSFSADYFKTQIHEDIAALKDSPFSVEIELTNGDRFHLWKTLQVRESTVTILVYPQKGKLPKYSKEDREGGMPHYYADAIVLPYWAISKIRLHKDQKMPMGFGQD